MTESAIRKRGLEKFTEVTQVPAIEVADQFVAENMDQCFGALWDRPGLTRRERRFLSLASVGSRGLESETRFHVRGALVSGDISSEEMMEIILHVRQYAGWPAGATMYSCYRDACTELGLEVPAPDDAR